MAFVGAVQLPDFSKSNALFDPQAVAQDAARTQVIQNAGAAGAQDLADRATLRDNALGVGAGDPTATATALGANPERATQFIAGLRGQQGAQRDQSMFDLESSANLAQTVLNTPPDQQASVYAAGRQGLAQAGHRNLPPEQFPGAGAMYAIRGVNMTAKEQIALDGARLTTSTDGALAYPGGVAGGMGGDVADAIHGQESGGKATSATSVDGAQGGWQVTPGTFAQYAKPGEQISNPADNERVGRRIIGDLSQKYGGDPARVAVGYFSGPGNVAPPGSPTPYIADHKDGNGFSTSRYVAGVLGRMGGAPAQSAAASPPVQVASTVGTPGLQQTATDASPAPAGMPSPLELANAPASNGPPVAAASPQGLRDTLGEMRLPSTASAAALAPAAPQNALQDAAPAAPTAAPQNALAPVPAAPVPAPAVPAAVRPPGPMQLQPGEQFLRNRGTGAIAAAPGETGMAYARDAQGNQVVRQLPGAVNEGRLSDQKQPDGSVAKVAPSGQVVTSSPADARNIPVQANVYNKDAEEIRGIADAGRNAELSKIGIQTSRDLISRITPSTSMQQIVDVAQRILPKDMATDFTAKVARMNNPEAVQELEKLQIQSSGADEKDALGSRGSLGATNLFLKANANPGLLPDANKAILAKKLISAQANSDYAVGAQAHFSANGDGFALRGEPYAKPLSVFDKQWNDQRNPQVYAAAMGAVAGQQPDQWAKGLAPDEYRRALDVVSRAAPNDIVQGKSGPISMAPPNAQGLAQQRAAPPPPAVGAVQQGHRFLGGDPSRPASWQALP